MTDTAKTVADFEKIIADAKAGIQRLEEAKKKFAKPGDILKENDHQVHLVVKVNGKFNFVPLNFQTARSEDDYLNKVYDLNTESYLNPTTGEIVGYKWENLGNIADYVRGRGLK